MGRWRDVGDKQEHNWRKISIVAGIAFVVLLIFVGPKLYASARRSGLSYSERAAQLNYGMNESQTLAIMGQPHVRHIYEGNEPGVAFDYYQKNPRGVIRVTLKMNYLTTIELVPES